MEKRKSFLRKVMLGIICAGMVISVSTSCTDEFADKLQELFRWVRTLRHDIDNDDVKAVDYMKANIKFTENESETNVPSSPAMEASIQLAKKEISVNESQLVEQQSLDADKISATGKEWNNLSATDNTTLEWYLPGGQTVTVPVNITALRTNYKGKYYQYGTDSLINSVLSVKYVPPSGPTPAPEPSTTRKPALAMGS